MKLLFPMVLCGLLATHCSAQNAPKTGYETLIAAGKLILPGENGSPSAPSILTPDENLRRQRLAVARNAPALKLMREVLHQDIAAPQHSSYEDHIYDQYGRLRELARQLIQESDVRLADGDSVGAMNSRLDCIEMGAAVTQHASLTPSLVGSAVQSIGASKIERVASQLDAPACRAALQRLRAIDARRASLLQTLQFEKEEDIRLSVNQIIDPKFQADLQKPRTPENQTYDAAEIRQLATLTPQALSASITRFYDTEIERETLPYPLAIKVVLPPAGDPFSASAAKIVYSTPNLRFASERSAVTFKFLEAALELRAIKLETGQYPATFDAGLDPFGDNSRLIYKIDGAKYRLYSIGPDGHDNGGALIETIEENETNGIKSLTNRLTLDSTGDISAPVF